MTPTSNIPSHKRRETIVFETDAGYYVLKVSEDGEKRFDLYAPKGTHAERIASYGIGAPAIAEAKRLSGVAP